MGRKNIYIKSASYSSVFENVSAAGGSAEQIQRQANDEYYKMLALHPTSARSRWCIGSSAASGRRFTKR